jgi:hypothetical protein
MAELFEKLWLPTKIQPQETTGEKLEANRKESLSRG